MSACRFEAKFGCPAVEKEYRSLDGSTRVIVDASPRLTARIDASLSNLNELA